MTDTSGGLSRVLNVRGHTFFPANLTADSIVLDLGANRGEFSMEMIRRFGLNSYAVEASPIMFAKLPTDAKFNPFNFAVTDSDKDVTFNLSENAEASSIHAVAVGNAAGSVTVPGKTISQFMSEQEIRKVDLMKVDIEGAEIAMLNSCSDELLRSIPQIMIEFHDFCGQVSTNEVDAAVSRLQGLGFSGIKFTRTNENWLFVQPRACGVSTAELAYVRYVVRNALGVSRMLTRAVAKK